MKIGILGSGDMAGALAPHWRVAGHEILIGGRHAANAQALAERLGVASGSLTDAAAFGDVVLLAVRSEGLEPTLEAASAHRGSLSGKVVVDCGNAVHLGDLSQVRWDGRSLAEQVAYVAVGSRVVKAFNLCHAEVWRNPATYGGRRLAVPVCGGEDAKAVAGELVRAVGAEPLDVGDLTQARHLEAMAIPMIRLLFSGLDPRTAFNLLPADPGAAAQ